jgi:hypothetical protein
LWQSNPFIQHSTTFFADSFFLLWFLFSFVWRWVFFERGPELDRKIPVSSKELRRRKKEFFDDLQQHCIACNRLGASRRAGPDFE